MIASPAQASWWDLLGKSKTTTLAKINDDPDAFKAVEVDFVIQFHETTGYFNPFFTRATKITPSSRVRYRVSPARMGEA